MELDLFNALSNLERSEKKNMKKLHLAVLKALYQLHELLANTPKRMSTNSKPQILRSIQKVRITHFDRKNMV
jgi:hypothetical protein